MTRIFARTMLPALAIVGLVAVAGCAPAADEPQPVVEPRADLDLTIGALLPDTGVISEWGPGTKAAVNLAIADINDAGTSLTAAAEFRDAADSSTDTGVTSANELMSLPVDAFVGPLSDGVSRKILDSVVEARIPLISPANSAPDFTLYDDKGFYWRTNPPCTLEASVAAEQVAASGATSAGILAQGGACGDQLPKAVRIALERLGVKVVADITVGEGGSVDAAIAEIAAAKPAVVAIVSPFARDAIAPLSAAGFKGNQLYFVGLPPSDYSADFAEGTLLGGGGERPGPDYSALTDFTDRLLALDGAIPQFRYTAETYDAVVLLALAALKANSTDGGEISAALQGVSGGGEDAGTVCTTYKACAAAITAGEAIDYEGVSSAIDFNEDGDPTGARIGVFLADRNGVFGRVDS